MDDILIESLMFGLVCGALLFLVTVAIGSESLRMGTHFLTAVALTPPVHYVYGLPAVSALITVVVLINAAVWALDTFETRSVKVFRVDDTVKTSAISRPVNTMAELQVCFS